MADGEPDISDLSPEQQEALQQYTMITDQSVQDAIPLLQRSQWNAQVRTCMVQSAFLQLEHEK